MKKAKWNYWIYELYMKSLYTLIITINIYNEGKFIFVITLIHILHDHIVLSPSKAIDVDSLHVGLMSNRNIIKTWNISQQISIVLLSYLMSVITADVIMWNFPFAKIL